MAVSTTTSLFPATTTTTMPAGCGNGVRDGGEECDPASLVPDCATGLVCGGVGTPNACRCVPPAGELVEICANCIDDDGNGLTDFEDPACCPVQRTFVLAVRKLDIRRRGQLSKLKLHATLAESGLADVEPLREDTFVQIRPENGSELLCAKAPALKFMRMHGAFKFWSSPRATPSAKGITDVKIRIRQDGSVRLRAAGRRVQMTTPNAGRLQITVGFNNPATGDVGNRCSIGFGNFAP